MNLNVVSPIGYTGYGYVGLNILRTLYENHTNNIGLIPIGNPNTENNRDIDIINTYINNVLSLPYDTTCLKIWHQFDLFNRPGNGKYFAMPFFEVDTLSEKDRFNLNFVPNIIVSCEWAKEILIRNNIKSNIYVVPLGVDTNTFNYTLNTNAIQDKYIFCTIGKWEKRKAHDTIIECFNEAFKSSDDVELWLVTNNSFLNKQQEQYWLSLASSSRLANKIKVFPRLPTHHDVANILSYSTCGIYISRGEGWNMELLETLAMDKPVIVSNYSAHKQYCTKENSFIVDMDETEPAIDNQWFFGEANWGKIGQLQKQQTIDYMRYLYSNNIRSNTNGLRTAQSMTWQKTVDSLIEVMK